MTVIACILGSVAFFIIIYCMWEAIDDNRTAITVLRGSVSRLGDENDSLRARIAKLEREKEKSIEPFVKERDAAFIDFVKTGDMKKVRAYCLKYGVQMPSSRKAFAAGIYKAVGCITSIPEDVKVMAMQKCLALGMNPFIKPTDYDMDEGDDKQEVQE